jgi:TPR repeat protein
VTPEAAALFQKACDGVDAKACAQLAWAYRCGGGVKQDLERSIALSEKACDERDFFACKDLALAIPNVEPPTAYRLAKKACSGAGHMDAAWACDRLAIMYLEGTSTAKDPPRAAKLFERECVPGSGLTRPWPCCKLCSSGNAGGCYELGRLYFGGGIDKGDVKCPRGYGCDRDRDKASTLYKRACDMGLAESCTALAELMSSR